MTEQPIMKVSLLRYPTEEDWKGVKQRALVTMYGKGLVLPKEEPTDAWKHAILEARHSPIRYLQFSFLMQNIPGNIATHFVRHVHAQPYVSSLRNDRQSALDGEFAPRNTAINLIFDVNAEELMVIMNKRLCGKAAPATRIVASMMKGAVVEACPIFEDLLVPMCDHCGGVCHEMKSCGYNLRNKNP